MKTMLMDLREKNITFTEIQEAFIILSSLDESYDQLVTSLEILPQSELTVLNITSKLLEEEQKRKDNRQLCDSKLTNQRNKPNESEEEVDTAANIHPGKRCFSGGSRNI